jgi:hypothetical protein
MFCLSERFFVYNLNAFERIATKAQINIGNQQKILHVLNNQFDICILIKKKFHISEGPFLTWYLYQTM